MKQIPRPTLNSAVKLTPLEMNAIHFGGLTSTPPSDPAPSTTSSADPIR